MKVLNSAIRVGLVVEIQSKINMCGPDQFWGKHHICGDSVFKHPFLANKLCVCVCVCVCVCLCVCDKTLREHFIFTNIY